jgi:hypothetical protein
VLLPRLHQQGSGSGWKWLLCSLIECLWLHWLLLLLLLLKVGLLTVLLLLLLLYARVVKARGLTESPLRLRTEAGLEARSNM